MGTINCNDEIIDGILNVFFFFFQEHEIYDKMCGKGTITTVTPITLSIVVFSMFNFIRFLQFF